MQKEQYTLLLQKGGGTDWKKAEEIKEKTYTFSGLESNVIYNIKVRVEKEGKAVEKEVNTRTGELPEGAVQFSPVEWRNGQAKYNNNNKRSRIYTTISNRRNNRRKLDKYNKWKCNRKFTTWTDSIWKII